ncbi:MAG TPA: SDR family oxidoreductase [Hyphomicrobiaceae bacterium]|jgi:NAD(P)-dependent dehydrogenase (short-subunit alcohol dehydrogenase family)|nr:SDR family oxidoreductase [Hyphomicrobiaceae bacterium]
MARLAGKVAFITGGGGGIGSATARRFAEEGARVVVADIDARAGEAAAEAARAAAGNSGGDAHFIGCDVTERASVAAAIAETVARYGKLDVLHNNAGGSTLQDGPVTEAPEEEFWRAIRLDLFGTFLCSKLGIPEIIKAGGGSVINMSSNVALMALPGRDCYTAAKGGIASMTRSMAVEYAPYKIRVNAIAPSVTLTDRVKRLLAGNAGVAKLAESHLLGLGQPIHIADMAVYLASDEAAITTGQVLSVDSGVTIY